MQISCAFFTLASSLSPLADTLIVSVAAYLPQVGLQSDEFYSHECNNVKLLNC